MKRKIDQIDFQIGITSLSTIILQKLQQLQISEVQFLRNFQSKIHFSESHPFLVFYFRQLINHFQQNFKDVKSYFEDLRIEFIYDFFRKMYFIMVNGINFISQALTIKIKQCDQQKQQKKVQNDMEKILQQKKGEKESSKGKLKIQLQNYDRVITYFENQQNKINDQIQNIKNNLMLGKNLVQKLKPSKVVSELNQIKEISQDLLQNTQKIFQETYQLKFLQFKDYVAKIKNSDDISTQFCKNIEYSLKDKFSKGIQKTLSRIVYLKQEYNHNRQVDCQTQTQNSQNKNKLNSTIKQPDKLHHLFLKQRKNNESLVAQCQVLTKQIQKITSQRNNLAHEKGQLQFNLKQKNQDYVILSNLYEEKKEQLSKITTNYRQMMSKNVLLKNQMKYKNNLTVNDVGIETDKLQLGPIQKQDQEVQTASFQHQTMTHLRKTILKLKQKINSHQLTIKQFKQKDNQEQIHQKYNKQEQFKTKGSILLKTFKQNSIINTRNQILNQNISINQNIYRNEEQLNTLNFKPKQNLQNSTEQKQQILVKISVKQIKQEENVQVKWNLQQRQILYTKKDIQEQENSDIDVEQYIKNIQMAQICKNDIKVQTILTYCGDSLEKQIQTQPYRFSQEQSNILTNQKIVKIRQNNRKLKKYAFNQTDPTKIRSKFNNEFNSSQYNPKKYSKLVQNIIKQQQQSNKSNFKYDIDNQTQQIIINDTNLHELSKNTSFQSLKFHNLQCRSPKEKRKDLKKVIMMNLKSKRNTKQNSETNKLNLTVQHDRYLYDQVITQENHQKNNKNLININKISASGLFKDVTRIVRTSCKDFRLKQKKKSSDYMD